MPPRQAPGALDQISEAIGELRAYVHEHRHGVNNISQKIDALGVKISRDMAAVEARIEIRIDAIEVRLANLERADAKRDGATSLAKWFVQSPLFAWLTAAAVVAWTWLKDHPR